MTPMPAYAGYVAAHTRYCSSSPRQFARGGSKIAAADLNASLSSRPRASSRHTLAAHFATFDAERRQLRTFYNIVVSHDKIENAAATLCNIAGFNVNEI